MSKERKTMNIDLMLEEMATQIKDLMTRLNYAVYDKGVPTMVKVGREIFGDTDLYAAYAPTEHCIFLNNEKPLDDLDALEIIAHELTHAYQDLSFAVTQDHICIDPTKDLYWEQEFERQAFTIGGTWMTLNAPEDAMGKETQIEMEKAISENPQELEERWVNTYRNFYRELASITY